MNIKSISKKEAIELLKKGSNEDKEIGMLMAKFKGVMVQEEPLFIYYYLKDGKYIIIDKYDGKGLLFEDRKAFYNFIIKPKEDWFKIEQINIFGQFNLDLEFLHNSNSHLTKLQEYFNLSLSFFDYTDSSIINIENLINSKTDIKVNIKNVFLPLYFYLGECFRKKVNGNWFFMPSSIFKNQLNLFINGKGKKEYYLWIPLWEELVSAKTNVNIKDIFKVDNNFYLN